jgi:cytochrome c biogenesis protein CcdA
MGYPADEKVPQGGEGTRGGVGPRGGVGLQGGAGAQNEDKRWLNVLEEVVEEQQTGRPWWQNVGIFLAWAAGFAVAASLAATLILALVELFQKGRQFTVITLSNYVFWASALLMVVGALSPSSVDLQGASDKKKKEEEGGAGEGRATQMLRRRMRRMYDPWRWRLWAGAILAFALSALVGLAAAP